MEILTNQLAMVIMKVHVHPYKARTNRRYISAAGQWQYSLCPKEFCSTSIMTLTE